MPSLPAARSTGVRDMARGPLALSVEGSQACSLPAQHPSAMAHTLRAARTRAQTGGL